MKDLNEWNKEKMETFGSYQSSGLPIKNGILCPQCGQELCDSTPNITLTSNPPQYNVHCNNCLYKGYRY